MCVIMIVEGKRPSEDMVREAFALNRDGGGVAFQEIDEATGESQVHWRKGLNVEQMVKECAELPTPFVAHFRIASIGKPIAQLTHPFPVSADVPLYLEGTTKGKVLFHNGTYHKWKETLFSAAINAGKPIPGNKWSDTRALAWIANFYGDGIMELLEAKGIIFGPEDFEIFWGDGWTKVEDIWCSNDFFTKQRHGNVGDTRHTNVGTQGNPTPCRWNDCQVLFNLNQQGYCFKHNKICREVGCACRTLQYGSEYCAFHHRQNREKEARGIVKDPLIEGAAGRSGASSHILPLLSAKEALRTARSVQALEYLQKKGMMSKNQMKKAIGILEKENYKIAKALKKHTGGIVITHPDPPLIIH